MIRILSIIVIMFFLNNYFAMGQTGCDVQASVCEPGQTQPFNFFPSSGGAGANNDFAEGSCATGLGGNHDYGYILLNVTQDGPMNLLVNGSSNAGFIDVIVFDVTGQNPCDAVLDASNEIGCNFAEFSSGCVQFGNEFGCISSVPAPNVQAGDQIMVIVQDWSTQSNSFTLELAPNGAQTGGFDATIDPVNNLEVTDPPEQITAVNNGGSWSASCGACIDPNTGIFNPAIAGDGTHEIYYSIGIPPCDDQDTTTIVVGVPCALDFDVITSITSCIGTSDGEAYVEIIDGVPPYTFEWDDPSNTTDSVISGLPQGTYQVTVSDDSACIVTQNVIIGEPDPFVITLSSDDALCFEDASGVASVDNSTGGTPPYSYAWNDSNNQIGEDAINLLAGTYVVTLTDDNGCSATDSIEVFEPLPLELDLGAEDTECSGGVGNGLAFVANLSGGVGPYTYQWNDANNQQTDTASSLNSGEYILTVTDVNGCQISDTITIFSPEGVFFTLDSDSALCNNSSTGSAFVDSISGGTPPYTYQWNDASSQTTPTATNLASGTYTLTVTDDNNCPLSLDVFVPEPSSINIDFSVENASCFTGNDGEISSTVSGGSPSYTYEWSNNEITQDIDGLEAGVYSLTVTDNNNCSVMESIEVGEPDNAIIEFTNEDVSCFEGSDATSTVNVVSGGTPPFTYLWNDSQAQSSQTATGLSAGSYSVFLTDVNGCTYSATTTINEPNLLTIDLSSTLITCSGLSDASASVEANGGTAPYNYDWSNGFNTSDIENIGAGSYDVIVTDANGCQESGGVTIDDPLPIEVSFETDSATCWAYEDGSITVFASGGSNSAEGFLYSIDGGDNFQTSNIFGGLGSGIFPNIIVQDLGSSQNCVSTPVSATVYHPNPMFVSIVPEDTILQLNESVTLNLEVDSSLGYSIEDITAVSWNPSDGLNCTDCLTPTVLTYENFITYEVDITYSSGVGIAQCFTSASSNINVENNLRFFIPDAFTPNADGVNDNFRVYGEGFKTVNLLVFNRWGEKLFESFNQFEGWDATYKGELVDPGVYTYYFEGEYLDGETASKKGSVTVLR